MHGERRRPWGGRAEDAREKSRGGREQVRSSAPWRAFLISKGGHGVEQQVRPRRQRHGRRGGGGMAPVRPVATVLHSEFSGKVRKIPVDPDWIRKIPVRSGRSTFGRNG